MLDIYTNVEYNHTALEVSYMSTVVYGILSEEKHRNLEMQKAYQREISMLRKGSVNIKKRGNKVYYYLRYRDGQHVRNDYLGTDISVVENVKNEIEKRKHLQGVLKRLVIEYKQICRIVKEP